MEIGEEEKEEDEGNGEGVHGEQQDDAEVIHVPPGTDAAHGVQGPQQPEERGNGEQQIGVAAGKAGERKRRSKAAEDEQVGAQQRAAAWLEERGGGEPTDWNTSL